MSKKANPKAEPKATVWQRIERRWFLIAGAVAVLGWLLLYSNTALSNLRTLPTEVRKTGDQFASWYYDDAGWSGYWTSEPEGYVDEPDMNLSQTPAAISLQVRHGQIDGMISTQAVCDFVPFFDFLLLRGHVNTFGNTATVVVWDTIAGRDRDFAKLMLTRNGVIMTVEPKEGAARLFPKARMARDPNANEWPTEFCEGKQAAMVKMLSQIIREQQTKKQVTQRHPKPKDAMH